MMKRLIKYIVVLILVALMFLGVAFFFSTRESSTYSSPETPVSVIYPERRVIQESYKVTGYIEAEAMVPVVPFVQGTILEFYAENDMEVKKDQVMAVIDPEPYELQKAQAEAQYLAYEATLKRISALYEKGAATEQNYDEVKAQRDAAKAQYDLASLQLSYCYVDTPVEGTILMTDGAVGGIATSSSPICVVADLSKLIVNVSIPEKYYLEMYSRKEDIKITVERKVGDETYVAEADLVSLSPYIDPTTKTFSAKVKLKGDVSAFRPGMMVDINVIYREENVLSLPQSVKKLDGSLYSVEEAKDGSMKAKYQSLPVLLSDDEYFQIDDSFADTRFIYRGQSKVLDGQSVVVVEGY